MNTIRQQPRQFVADFPAVLLTSLCVADLGSEAASVVAQFSDGGHSKFFIVKSMVAGGIECKEWKKLCS